LVFERAIYFSAIILLLAIVFRGVFVGSHTSGFGSLMIFQFISRKAAKRQRKGKEYI